VLLDGTTPAYRPMAQGDEGTDVLQLERNLIALGDDADGALDEADDEFGWATAAARPNAQQPTEPGP
jgi:peptidoglycan hydrolase-like protein with peptidoglycan-binding domain